jgi:AAA domain (dynein-related subfamily)
MPALNIREHEVTIAEAVPMLDAYLDAGDPVFLWGMPGIGKTSIVEQLGAGRKWPVIVWRANLREPVDARGIPVPDLKTGTTRWFTPDELPQEKRDGKNGILFLDELNTASDQMMAVMMGLVLERQIGEYRLPDGWVIVAAGNRVGDRAAARRLPTALRNRFAHIYIKPDVDAWCTWANASGVAPEVVAFVRLRRELLHVMPAGDENAFPTPRSITKAAKHIAAPRKLRMRLFAGHIGDAPAGELDGFIDLYHSIGSLDDILKDPTGAKLPTEPSIRFAVCTGLARMATRQNFSAVMTFAKRLPREPQTLLITDAVERDDKLKETTAYGKWAVDNQDITLQMH